MSVLVKGMKMPKTCWECFAENSLNIYVVVFGGHYPFAERRVHPGEFDAKRGRHPSCPLVEVPTPHGRLKDEKELIKAINEKADSVSENRGRGATIPSIAWFSGISSALSIIEAAPAIIEAEEGAKDE